MRMISTSQRAWATSRLGILLLTLTLVTAKETSITCSSCPCQCRSNSSHVAWHGSENDDQTDILLATSNAGTSSSCCCQWQTWTEAEWDAYHYLRHHVMQFDLPSLGTLGFADDDEGNDDGGATASSKSALPDGLSGGLIGPTIQYALQAKVQFWHADQVPKKIWQEYVLNYAHTNEARSNWRPYLWDQLLPLLTSRHRTNHLNDLHHDDHSASSSNVDDDDDDVSYYTIDQVVEVLNRDMWTLLAPRNQETLYFLSSQTPLIFDPMSVLVFGYASCTGLAILFASALRTMGIPARVAGTPAWQQNRPSGNHNWVEVWWPSASTSTNEATTTSSSLRLHNDEEDKSAWHFLEPSPNQTIIDTLNRDPCQRWFCRSKFFHEYSNISTSAASATMRTARRRTFERDAAYPPPTQVYAARLSSSGSTFFRLAWEWNNQGVPADDRTKYYVDKCGSCDL